MKFTRNFSVVVSTILIGFCASATESKSAAVAAPTEKKDLVTSFRCEKFSGSGLGDLKLKMIETCDLDKPFSSSLSRTVGGDDVYMFCCHKAK